MVPGSLGGRGYALQVIILTKKILKINLRKYDLKLVVRRGICRLWFSRKLQIICLSPPTVPTIPVSLLTSNILPDKMAFEQNFVLTFFQFLLGTLLSFQVPNTLSLMNHFTISVCNDTSQTTQTLISPNFMAKPTSSISTFTTNLYMETPISLEQNMSTSHLPDDSPRSWTSLTEGAPLGVLSLKLIMPYFASIHCPLMLPIGIISINYKTKIA